MKVMSFHLMPYADLDLTVKDKYKTVWIVLPNSYFDPVKGHALYNRYLDELELCAELGFDGVCVNEHHQNAYGLMPSPVVMASALARRTRGCRIAILGNAFCLREHPLTLAEEHAMIDVITGGRPVKYVPPAPVFSWSGFYVGAHVGGTWGTTEAEINSISVPGLFALAGFTLPVTSQSFNGFIGGGQVGWNWQSGIVVFGVEGELSGTNGHGAMPPVAVLREQTELDGDCSCPPRPR